MEFCLILHGFDVCTTFGSLVALSRRICTKLFFSSHRGSHFFSSVWKSIVPCKIGGALICCLDDLWLQVFGPRRPFVAEASWNYGAHQKGALTEAR